jgi:hypothetical protein
VKVSELIEELSKLDGELVVVMSQDSEGNGYGRLRVVEAGSAFDVERGEVGLQELTEDDRAAGYGDEDVMAGGEPCVCLWP